MKWSISYRYTKAFFIYRVTQKISDILWAMLQNSWKCIFICILWVLILFNKIEKCLCIRFACLSVRLSVYSLTPVIYSLNVLKFIYAIYIRYRMERIENVMYGAKGSSTEANKSFPIHYGVWRSENFKADYRL